MSVSTIHEPIEVDELRRAINEISDSLCSYVDGNFDLRVEATSTDPDVAKLRMLVHFVVDVARRSVSSLRDRNERLSELDRLKTEFLALVTHELRTPVTLILSPLRSLLAGEYGPVSAEARHVLERMEANGVHLGRTIEDLLLFSRLDGAGPAVAPRVVDVGGFLSPLVADVRAASGAAPERLAFRLEGAPRPVRVDPHLLARAVLNLVGNALKFTGPEDRITVVVREVEEATEVEVADTGPGIPESLLEGVFERFKQLDSSSSRNHEGLGLGLSLVKELTEAMGGVVSLESSDGAGARFRLRFSAVEEAPEESESIDVRESAALADQWPGVPDAAAREAQPRPASPGKAPSDAPTVLVVEDNAGTREYLREILAREYRVRSACNGAEALASVRRELPDLIVSDVMMPVTDGRALVGALRADPEAARVPVILLTALASGQDLSDGLDGGANDYLTKPFHPEELRARARVALRVARLEEERRAQEAELLHARRLRSLGVLAGGVAHDFNNLLSVILGNADLALEVLPEGAEAREHLEAAVQATLRSREVVGKMLSYSGRGGFLPGRVELAQKVGEMRDRLATAIGPRGELTCSFPDVPVLVDADTGQLGEVLWNLVTNATEAYGEASGPVRVDVGTVRTDFLDPAGFPEGLPPPPGTCAFLRVSDSGAGISPEGLPAIFDPFFSTKSPGRGLGLSVVLGAVRGAGGGLHVYTEPARGTQVTVLLPLVEDAAAASHVGEPCPEPEEASRRVLLVDDERGLRELLGRALRKRGFVVLEAESGEEALEVFRDRCHEVDCVLMDVTMPRLSGPQTYARMREIRHEVPVVWMSGYSREEIPEGMGDHFLGKPFRVRELVRVLDEVLGG